MSLTADPAAALSAVRRCGLTGGNLTSPEMRNVLACLLAATGAAENATANTDTVALAVLVTSQKTHNDAQFDILDAFTVLDTAADIVAAIATASTLLRADATASNSAGITAALSSAAMLASTPAANPVIDGYDD